MSGGQDAGVEYSQSPEQRAIYEALKPLVSRLGAVATGEEQYISGYEKKREWIPGTEGQWVTSGQGKDREGRWEGRTEGRWGEREVPIYAQTPTGPEALWDVPNAPMAPKMGQDYMSANQYYNQNGPAPYTPPDASGLMPTSNWYNSLSPEVMAGLNQPWDEARDQMFETMGDSAGSARGGFSGAGGAALGEFEAQRATQLPLQAWNMSQPGMQTAWNAQHQVGMGDYINAQDRTMQDYGMYSQGYNQDYNTAMNIWGQQAQQSAYPWTTLPGMLGGTYSTPVVNQGQMNPWPGMIGGIGGAAIGAYATRTPQGAAVGYGVGSGVGNAAASSM